MAKSTAEKITLLNGVTLESLREGDKMTVIKKFTEAGIKIFDADFGFAWAKKDMKTDYKLVYKSPTTPYEPNPPRKQGGNAKARQSRAPYFVPDTSKEKYGPKYDVRPYMKSYVIIPIVYGGNFYGNTILCFKKKKSFSKEDNSIAEALGNSMAQALTINGLYTNLENFQKTLDNTLDSIFIFSPDSLEMSYVNNGATIFTRQSRKELLSKKLYEIVSGMKEEDLQQKIQEILDDPQRRHSVFEAFINHPEKGKLSVEIYLQHVDHPDQPDEFLAIVRDITERKNSELSMSKMAYHDALTGIPNRAFLTERLIEEHAAAKAGSHMYGIIFIDLDRFKIINDIYGHNAGDSLLKQVAQRMRKALPKKAILSRMGGDEFIVLLPKIADTTDVEKCANELLGIFSEYFLIDEQEIYCNGSAGFSVFPTDGNDYHVVMKHADLALHRAKERGGGNAQQYRTGQPLHYTMQPKLQHQLRQALKHNELELQYQPIINTKTKRIIGTEALVRWNHPEMGLILPKDFVGQAEESGLIIEMGEWVLREVCRQIQIWENEGRIPPPVSINLSPRELLRPTLVENISAALNEFKISPSQIKLELTETFLMKNIDLSASILEQLRALGIRILIDDFGTGYASLNYLKRLPIDAVKIDRSFIAGVPVSLQDAALTSAIIAISHQLGLGVVAEGVENNDQFEFLRAANCNYAQGNFFFKPVSGVQLGDLLRLANP